MGTTIDSFGIHHDGIPVNRFTMSRGGVTVSLIEYAAAIQQLLVPDPQGREADIVLGYDTIEGYEKGRGQQGAVIGRHANRIEGAEFTLSGKNYQLTANNGRHNLHSGPIGLSKRLWSGELVTDPLFDLVRFTIESPDGDQGFPGNLTAKVTYHLDDSGSLTLEYQAQCDQDTVVNLTNHAYFNLAGMETGSMLDQILMMPSEFYTAVNDEGLPNGEIRRVADTVFDFRTAKAFGRDIEAQELQNVHGFDHNWIVPGQIGQLRLCAVATDPASERRMEVWTTMPGVQLYTANTLPEQVGKCGSRFGKNSGFCLETQYFPNSMCHNHFPSPILKAGATYHHKTVFKLKP